VGTLRVPSIVAVRSRERACVESKPVRERWDDREYAILREQNATMFVSPTCQAGIGRSVEGVIGDLSSSGLLGVLGLPRSALAKRGDFRGRSLPRTSVRMIGIALLDDEVNAILPRKLRHMFAISDES